MVSYPLTFNAAILEQNNKPLVIDQVRFSGPLLPGQVLVQIYYSGICGKQIEEIKGTAGKDPYLPHMLGHEGSGIVSDIGPGVTKVQIGDQVILHWLKASGLDAPAPFYSRKNGERINAGWITTFNEYGVVPENRITKIPKESDLSLACLLGCAVTTGLGVIFNEAHVRPAESIAIFGCGGVGLCSIQGAKNVHAYPIIAVDKNNENLTLAKKMGATHILNPATTNIPAEIKNITQNNGAYHSLVTAAYPDVIETAAASTSAPGNVFIVGVPAKDATVTINALDLHRRKMFTGSYGGGCLPDRDIPRYLTLYEQGHLQLKELITTTISLQNINEGTGFSTNRSTPPPGRCIVKML